MKETPEVGQVWEDMDPRQKGRRLKIERIEGPTAYVLVLTDPTLNRQRKTSVGRHTMIALDRLREGSRGYKLVKRARKPAPPKARKRIEARAPARLSSYDDATVTKGHVPKPGTRH